MVRNGIVAWACVHMCMCESRWGSYDVLFMMMIFMVNSILVTNADWRLCATKRRFGFCTKIYNLADA